MIRPTLAIGLALTSCGVLMLTGGCSGGRGPDLQPAAAPTIASPTADLAADVQVLRVGGDAAAQTNPSPARSKDDGSTFTMYRSGRHVVGHDQRGHGTSEGARGALTYPDEVRGRPDLVH